MPDELLIAPVTDADFEAVAALERVCFSAPWSVDALRSSAAAGVRFLTAKRGGRLCGYCGLQIALDEGYLTNLAVAPFCRRQGVGRALLASLCNLARAENLTFLTLEVRETNLAAQALYAGAGFRPVGRRPRFYTAPTEDAILMTKEFLHEDPRH